MVRKEFEKCAFDRRIWYNRHLVKIKNQINYYPKIINYSPPPEGLGVG